MLNIMVIDKEPLSNKKYWYQKGTRRKMLPDPLIKAFRNKQISCVEYSELTEDQEREIFQVYTIPLAYASS